MSRRNIPRQSPNVSSTHSAAQGLFNQILDIGEKLLEADSELYKTAVAHLHANVPREPSPVRRAAGAEQKGVKGDSARRSSTAFHKYNLPGDAGKREYYQCMICSERRTTNSFHADHQHEGEKLSVRWYCPLCDTLYAVTHRGYHIKNRHKSPGAAKKGDEGIKSESNSNSGSEFEDADAPPPVHPPKKRLHEDDETSVCSEEGPANVLANLVGKKTPPITTVQPPPPILSSNMAAEPAILSNNDTGAPITHTVTQEALMGGGSSASLATSDIFRLTDSSNVGGSLVGAATEAKLMFSSNLATITHA